MKILALSLLRVGDFFHHVHLLRELQKSEPGSEIHVLIFSEASVVRRLFPEFHFHEINRFDLQQDLVERHRTWRRALSLLLERSEQLNDMNFARIYNFTHTLFAARLMDLLESPDKRGSQFVEGISKVESRELRYVNEIWSVQQEPLLNWIEVTAASVGLPTPSLPEHPLPRAGKIWMQVMTSDQKKNWPISSWRGLARRLLAQGEDCRFVCAPGEVSLLMTVLGEDLADRVEAMSFEQMRERSQECALLVSGDTSALHYAVLVGIPVLGLYLGPANPFKTPPWQKGAGIWWARVTCAPCGHRESCSQSRHLCGEALNQEQVAASILACLKNEKFKSSDPTTQWSEIGDMGRMKVRRENVIERSRRIFDEGFAEA